MRRVLLRSSCLLALSLSAVACGGDDTQPAAKETPETLSFPTDGSFQWGAAVAGFQVDMGCPTLAASECEDTASDWYQFVTDPAMIADPKNYLSGQPMSVSPGFWELYEQDLDRQKDELHQTSLRLSIEWSRIFPTATDGVTGHDALKAVANQAAIDHYHAVFAALKARGLRPLVTLNHYTLPTWIHDGPGCHTDLANCSPRGWLDKDRTVTEIAKYAGFCAEEFGGEVDQWATLNEPFAVMLPGYIFPTKDRSNPPAVSLQFEAAKTVLVGLVEAHARMYDAIEAADTVDADGDGDPAFTGVVYAMAPAKGADPTNDVDTKGAENLFYLFNLVYLNAVAKGDLDADLDGTAEHRDDLANRMDYIGVNYYTRVTAQGTTTPFLADLSPLTTFNALTLKTWETYPKGIYDMAKLVKDRFDLPVIITENGLDDGDGSKGEDFLVRHLTWVSRALADGVDLRGYFFWSLVDNYEWNHGMDMHFGLYGIDKDDPMKTRTARPIVATYADIAQRGLVSRDLSAAHPEPR